MAESGPEMDLGQFPYSLSGQDLSLDLHSGQIRPLCPPTGLALVILFSHALQSLQLPSCITRWRPCFEESKPESWGLGPVIGALPHYLI